MDVITPAARAIEGAELDTEQTSRLGQWVTPQLKKLDLEAAELGGSVD